MSLPFKIAQNTFYQIVSKAIGTVIGLFTVGLITRYLGQSGFGYYTTIISFLQFFSVLADFGLQMTTNQLISKPGTDEQKTFNNALTFRVVSVVVMLILAIIIGWLSPYPLIVKTGLTLASLSFLFISIQSVLISLFQKKMEMKKVALAEIWSRVVLFIGVWLAIVMEYGLFYLIGAVVLGSLANAVILYFYSLGHFKIKPSFNFKEWGKIWKTTWPLAITIGLTLVYFRADTIVMSFSRPASEVGIYGAAYKVVEVMVQFPYLFLGIILPLLTNFFITNKKLFSLTAQKAFDFITIITVPMIFSILVLGEKVMVFISGQEFFISGQLLKILIFAVAAIFWGALFGYIIVSCELQKKMIKFYLFDAIISIILYLILIPIYSYWAAAYLTIMTEVIITVSAFYVLKKHAKLSFKFNLLPKTIAASLIMAAILLLLLNQNLIILIVTGLIAYLWSLYLLKGVDKNSILSLLRPN